MWNFVGNAARFAMRFARIFTFAWAVQQQGRSGFPRVIEAAHGQAGTALCPQSTANTLATFCGRLVKISQSRSRHCWTIPWASSPVNPHS